MNDSTSRPPSGAVEVIPPSRGLPIITRAESKQLTAALVERIRLWGAERVIRGLEAVIHAETLVFEAAKQRNEAHIGFEKSRVLLEEADNIIEAERRKIRAEIEQEDLRHLIQKTRLKTELEDAQFQQEYQKVVREIEKVRKDLARDNIASPREKKSLLDSKLDELRERSTKLGEIGAFCEELFKRHGVDSENDLPVEAKAILRKFREAIELGVED